MCLYKCLFLWMTQVLSKSLREAFYIRGYEIGYYMVWSVYVK